MGFLSRSTSASSLGGTAAMFRVYGETVWAFPSEALGGMRGGYSCMFHGQGYSAETIAGLERKLKAGVKAPNKTITGRTVDRTKRTITGRKK